MNAATPLARSAEAASPPVRIVHLGLGSFFRAHQAWYTAHASDAARWGIAAFTGRDAAAADALAAQHGLYSLVERGADGDRVEVVASVVEAWDGSRLDRLSELLADPRVSIVTLTITEGGYRLDADGAADLGDPTLAGDLTRLRAAADAGAPWASAAPLAALARLVAALDARRAAGVAPLAIVSCDNLPRNGELTRSGVVDIATRVDPTLADWILDTVSFVSTSVDRITPRLSRTELDGVIDVVAEAGRIDAIPVVAEPFSDWTISGAFPGGRPDWESAGVRFVADIEPWENRKLWLLNGAHSLLAYAGLLRGHTTVSEAIADPHCRALVEHYWEEAVLRLPAGIEHVDYRCALLARFANPRIRHQLEQIAAEGTAKVRFRFAAVAERGAAASADTVGSLGGIAAWIRWLQAGHRAPDAAQADVDVAVASTDPVAALLTVVSPSLAADPAAVASLRLLVASDKWQSVAISSRP